MLTLIGFLILILELVSCEKYNVTYEDLTNCKQYYTVGGYGYQTYFKIDDIYGTRPADTIVHLKLYVLAAKDAHLILTTTESVNITIPVYEIVLGAGGNTFSEIRRKRKSSPLTTTKRKDVLSPVDILPIIITISKDGLFQVTISGEQKPLLEVTDPNPLEIKYIGFGTWGTVQGKWFYDCGETDSDELEMVGKSVTSYDRLKIDLSNGLDPHLMPENLTNIDVQFEIIALFYNSIESFMTTRGIFKLYWFDPKMTWNPDNYDNITNVNVVSSNESPIIWNPSLILINGKDISFREFNVKYTARIFANGSIIATTKEINFDTWCTDTDMSKNWPSDKLSCKILLGARNIALTSIATMDPLKISKSNFDQHKWNLLSVQLSNGEYEQTDADELYNADIEYRLILGRNQSFYKHIFCTPLTVSIIYLLLSFWSDGYKRIGLILISFIITAIVLVIIVNYTPITYVPLLVRYYEFTMIISWLFFIISIANIWFKNCEPEHNLSFQLILDRIQMIFGKNIMKNQTSYNHLENTTITSSISAPITGDILKFIDRFFFTCFLIFAVAALVTGI